VGFQVAHAKISGMGSLFCGGKLVAVVRFNHGNMVCSQRWSALTGVAPALAHGGRDEMRCEMSAMIGRDQVKRWLFWPKQLRESR